MSDRQKYDKDGALRGVTGGPLRPGGLALTKRALDFCALPPGARVLDAGCGPGDTLALLNGMGLGAWGLDVDEDYVREAGRHGKTFLAPLEATGLPDDCFDAVFCECVLNLTRRPEALREIGRILKPGGLLVATDIFLAEPPGKIENRADPAGSADRSDYSNQSSRADCANQSSRADHDAPADTISQNDKSGKIPPENETATIPSENKTAENTQDGQAGGQTGDGCVSGATKMSEFTSALRELGFEPELTEDHARALSSLAAALVWAYGAEGPGLIAGSCGGARPPGGKKPRLTYGQVVARLARRPE